MNEIERETINELLDAYDILLTEKQRDIMSLYYKEDFSLAEIAENMDISRSAVSDTIKRSEKILCEYEEKLKLNEKFKKRNEIYGKIKSLGQKDLDKYLEELELIEDSGGNYEQ